MVKEYMLDIVPVFFGLGMILGFISGLVSVKCYFSITGSGIESLFWESRPNVYRMIKAYKKGELKLTDQRLEKDFNWVFYLRRFSLISFAISAIAFVLAAVI